MTQPHPLLILSAVLLTIALIAWLSLALRRAWMAWRLAQRMDLAGHGEAIAERWLESQGYRLLDRQVTRRATMRINNRIAEYDVRADLLVQIGSEQAIVEVKTGEAADPRHIPTRRQLREYSEIFQTDAIYLFDATNLRLHKIEFPE